MASDTAWAFDPTPPLPVSVCPSLLLLVPSLSQRFSGLSVSLLVDQHPYPAAPSTSAQEWLCYGAAAGCTNASISYQPSPNQTAPECNSRSVEVADLQLRLVSYLSNLVATQHRSVPPGSNMVQLYDAHWATLYLAQLGKAKAALGALQETPTHTHTCKVCMRSNRICHT